jgi:hypothetical protein
VSKADKKLYEWIKSQYLDEAFNTVGFIGWSKLQDSLISQRPQQREEIVSALRRRVNCALRLLTNAN